jgi:membrane associated rhomboid family serine protease
MDVFGNNIEDRMRKIPFLIFYLACGYVGAYGFAAANPSSAASLIGASGAIAGPGRLPGALSAGEGLELWCRSCFFIPVRIPAWAVLGLWFVLQWAYSAGISTEGAGSVAYLAHVFGFLAGALVGLVMRAGSRAASNA